METGIINGCINTTEIFYWHVSRLVAFFRYLWH
jgi:hypothetical protein